MGVSVTATFAANTWSLEPFTTIMESPPGKLKEPSVVSPLFAIVTKCAAVAVFTASTSVASETVLAAPTLVPAAADAPSTLNLIISPNFLALYCSALLFRFHFLIEFYYVW